MRRALLALVLPALLTSLVPTASAQICPTSPTCATTVQLDIKPPADPIPVAQGQVVVPMVVTYVYTQTLSLTMSPTPIMLKVKSAPDWLDATISPSVVYAPVNQVHGLAAAQQTTAMVRMPANLLLSAMPDAPAFVSAPIEIQAYAPPNGQLSASETRNAISIQADYFSLVQVSPAGDVGLAPGGSQTLPLTVTNFGNGLTKVSWALDAAPKGVNVRLPGELTLQSRQQGGARHQETVSLRLSAPGSFEDGDVVLLARSSYALDPALAGDTSRVAVHVHHGEGGQDVMLQSFGAGEPLGVGLQTGLLAAGLAASVLVVRRMKR